MWRIQLHAVTQEPRLPAHLLCRHGLPRSPWDLHSAGRHRKERGSDCTWEGVMARLASLPPIVHGTFITGPSHITRGASQEGAQIPKRLFSLPQNKETLHSFCCLFFILILPVGNRAIFFSASGYFPPVSPPETSLPTQPTHTSFWSSFEPQQCPCPAMRKERRHT